MKTLILPLMALLCLSLNASAQTGACSFQAFSVEFLSSRPSPDGDNTYEVTVNLTWDIEANKGLKYSYFHLWQGDDYVPFGYSNPSRAPKASDLRKSLGTIIVKDPFSDDYSFHDTYNPDPSYKKILPLTGTGAKLTTKKVDNKTVRFTIENLVIRGLAPQPFDIYRFKGDFWSSQKNDGTNVHCSMKENQFAVNDLASRSSLNCSGSGSVSVRVQTADADVSGIYQVYADSNSPGVFEEATDTPLCSAQSFTTGATPTMAGGWPFAFAAPAVTVPAQYKGSTVWVVINAVGKSRQVFALSNSCMTLPVVFANFSVARNKQMVAVKWQTSAESNVAGFSVQRFTNSNWATVSFVPAKNLANGSSYEFTDNNNYKGLSQYRIVSIDIDGKQKLSEVRSVRGEEANTKMTAFPNPSTTGLVNLVFHSSAVRDVSVIDMSGRVVKQLQVSGVNVSFEMAQNGLYQVQVTDRTTGERITERIIIKKR